MLQKVIVQSSMMISLVMMISSMMISLVVALPGSYEFALPVAFVFVSLDLWYKTFLVMRDYA